jgi:hypothetical protein
LPESFRFGDIFQSYDLRLARDFKFGEQVALELVAEVFNLFNISNLTGFNGQLNFTEVRNPDGTITRVPNDFGQPTSKAGQAFGFGGPRAFQFGAKFKF